MEGGKGRAGRGEWFDNGCEYGRYGIVVYEGSTG